MKKVDRIIGWCRRHVMWTNAGVISTEGIIALLLWQFLDLKPAFADAQTYMFFWITIVIASTAALNSMFASMSAHDSLYVANEGLILTRATQRPFLNIEGNPIYSLYPESIGQIKVDICNKGIFPADEVSVSCEVRKENEDDNWHSLSLVKSLPSIYFPDDIVENCFEETPDDKSTIKIEPSSTLVIRIDISYKNKTTSKEHRTFRLYSAACTQQGIFFPLVPIPQEDFWV